VSVTRASQGSRRLRTHPALPRVVRTSQAGQDCRVEFQHNGSKALDQRQHALAGALAPLRTPVEQLFEAEPLRRIPKCTDQEVRRRVVLRGSVGDDVDPVARQQREGFSHQPLERLALPRWSF
jgi:hypothetical protein